MSTALPCDAPAARQLPPASAEEFAAASFYEDFLVPALFRQYAPKLIAAAGLGPGERLLDVACGTGVVTRAAADVTGANLAPVGLDISPGMLAVARQIDPAIDWRHGDVEDLPFADASFDRVVCQFGLMFFTDPVQALGQMLRVLKPGGRLAVAVWDSISQAPGSAELVSILERLAGPRAAEALSLPYRLGDIAQLERLATAAGIGEIEIRTHDGEAHFPGLQVLIDAEIRGWLPIMGVHLEEALIEAIADECERRFRPYTDPRDGALRTPTSAHILTGRRRA